MGVYVTPLIPRIWPKKAEITTVIQYNPPIIEQRCEIFKVSSLGFPKILPIFWEPPAEPEIELPSDPKSWQLAAEPGVEIGPPKRPLKPRHPTQGLRPENSPKSWQLPADPRSQRLPPKTP
jgi:hypothetical protein